MWLLLAGGVAGGLSNDFALVLAARVAEGLAAGVVQPIPAIIILRAFEPHEQGRASGIFGMGVVLAPAIGPSIGGVLVDWFGWRSIFFMVVPFCLASLWLAQRYVPMTAPGGAARPTAAARRWTGAACCWAARARCACSTAWSSCTAAPACRPALLLGGAGGGAGGVCGVAAPRWGAGRRTGSAEPLMNLALFGSRPFAMGSIVAFIYGMALFGSTYLLPVYMQLGLGLSPSYVGTILLPAGLVLAVTIGIVGRLADRQPTWLLVCVGLALLAASFALMVTIGLASRDLAAGGLGHPGAHRAGLHPALAQPGRRCAGWSGP